MENNQLTPTDHDSLDKTASFKVTSQELASLKQLADQNGMSLSEYLRQLSRPSSVSQSPYGSLPREIQTSVDLQLATDKIARLENELTQAKQAYAQERTKRKKLKKELLQARQDSEAAKREADAGLSGLVTQHPQLGEILCNGAMSFINSPAAQKGISALMGLDKTGLSEEDQVLLDFGHELRKHLTDEELRQVIAISRELYQRKNMLAVVIRTLHKPAAPPAASSNQPAGQSRQGQA